MRDGVRVLVVCLDLLVFYSAMKKVFVDEKFDE